MNTDGRRRTMTLAERLTAHAARMQSEDPLPNLPAWITGATSLLREAADRLAPRTDWPPEGDMLACIGRSERGHGHTQWESLAYGSGGWYWVTGEQPADECPPDAWLPWPEGGGE